MPELPVMNFIIRFTKSRNFLSKTFGPISRQFVLAIFVDQLLKPVWKLEHGGELSVFQNEIWQNIVPTGDKTVLHKNIEIRHDVWVTQKPRLSITGWLKR
jgi:SM-20-related protein